MSLDLEEIFLLVCIAKFKGISLHVSKKLVTVVEGDAKDPLSIATTPRCREALLLSLDCSILPSVRTL